MKLLPTTLVGSWAQPDWLIDRGNLKSRVPPRIRAKEIWQVPEDQLQEAKDDATILAVHDQEHAGIDIIGDGEMRRESYSNRFATALDGLDLDNPGTAIDRTGKENFVPKVVGEIKRARPVEVGDIEFLRRQTDKPIKITLPGPFTMTQQAQNDFYDDDRDLALAYADAVNEEVRDLFAAGVDIVQLDEPYLQAHPEEANRYGVEAVNRAVKGVSGTTALHNCFGYGMVHGPDAVKPDGYSFLPQLEASNVDILSIEAAQPNLVLDVLASLPSKIVMLGVLNLGTTEVETPEIVADRIRAALEFKSPEQIWVAPDCGFKYLPRDVSMRKLKAMVLGADIVRAELSAA